MGREGGHMVGVEGERVACSVCHVAMKEIVVGHIS